MPGAVPRLVLFVRRGCTLCEDLHHDLLHYRDELRFELELVDIDRDPQLRRVYDTRVPVLVRDGREICHYYLDPVALRSALTAE